MTKIYDQFLEQVNKNLEEIEISTIKAETVKNKEFLSKEFALLTGSCLNKDKYML